MSVHLTEDPHPHPSSQGVGALLSVATGWPAELWQVSSHLQLLVLGSNIQNGQELGPGGAWDREEPEECVAQGGIPSHSPTTALLAAFPDAGAFPGGQGDHLCREEDRTSAAGCSRSGAGASDPQTFSFFATPSQDQE